MDSLSGAMALVLKDYHDRYAVERQRMKALGEATWDHADELLLPIGPATGRILHDLIVAGRYRSILDIGTSFGYSALWFADAARHVGGRVISVDNVPAKQAYARAQLERAGLAAQVEFVAGDIREVLRQREEVYDFVLIDVLWKDLYPVCLELVRPRLAAGAVVAADNMTFPDPEAAEVYRRLVREDEGFSTVLLPVGSGVELSVFAARRPAPSLAA